MKIQRRTQSQDRHNATLRVYHAAPQDRALRILAQQRVIPRGNHPGRFSQGYFGGNPSHPEWVYV